MVEYILESFDHDKAMNGAELVYIDALYRQTPIIQFTYFDSVLKGDYKRYAFESDGYLSIVSLKEAERLIKIKSPIQSIPFDPEKLKEGWLVKTKAGHNINEIAVFYGIESEFKVYGVYNNSITQWTLKGTFYLTDTSDKDLVMYPPRKE